MADLLIELWHSVFDLLELRDVSSCALVSKKFYFTVKDYRIREIAFTRRVHDWFHYYLEDHKHRLDFKDVFILKSALLNFHYLKRLKIGRSSAIDLNVINQLISLETLDIDLKNYDAKNRTLSLPNLKTLLIFVPDDSPTIVLNTPKLGKVYTFLLKKLVFLFPNSVWYINTFFDGGKLSIFCNLELLWLNDQFKDPDYVYSHSFQSFEFNLASLKKLRKIEFFYNKWQVWENNSSKIKRLVKSILDLERPKLEIILHDVLLTDINLLTEYENVRRSSEHWLPFQLRHYEKINDKTHLVRYEFNSIMSSMLKAGFKLENEKFISTFLDATSSVEIILVYGAVKDQELFMRIVAGTPALMSLKFSNSGLGQPFFDRMAETVRLNGLRLKSLRFQNASKGALNFEFVSKFPDLQLFEIDQQLPNDLILKMLRLPTMNEIGFGFSRIQRMSANDYLLNGESFSRQELFKRFGDEPNPTVSDQLKKSTCLLM